MRAPWGKKKAASPVTVLAVPGELLAAASGRVLQVFTTEPGVMAELRIPSPAEYRKIMQDAYDHLLRAGYAREDLPPVPSGEEILRITRPLSRSSG